MDKIKDKSTAVSFFGLRDMLFSSPLERAGLHLGIAKNLFVLSALLYYFALLMTLSGAYTFYSATATFFLYPIFVFSTLSLAYNLLSYGIVIYMERYLFLRYIILLVCIALFLFIISIHLGLSNFLLSTLGIK